MSAAHHAESIRPSISSTMLSTSQQAKFPFINSTEALSTAQHAEFPVNATKTISTTQYARSLYPALISPSDTAPYP